MDVATFLDAPLDNVRKYKVFLGFLLSGQISQNFIQRFLGKPFCKTALHFEQSRAPFPVN